jgi:hypothetical protein
VRAPHLRLKVGLRADATSKCPFVIRRDDTEDGGSGLSTKLASRLFGCW